MVTFWTRLIHGGPKLLPVDAASICRREPPQSNYSRDRLLANLDKWEGGEVIIRYRLALSPQTKCITYSEQSYYTSGMRKDELEICENETPEPI